MCNSRKYPYSPTEGIGISWGVGGPVKPKNSKKCMKLNWNFPRGGGVLKKMDIFWSYTIHDKHLCQYLSYATQKQL